MAFRLEDHPANVVNGLGWSRLLQGLRWEKNRTDRTMKGEPHDERKQVNTRPGVAQRLPVDGLPERWHWNQDSDKWTRRRNRWRAYAYLECGIPDHGFVRLGCDTCYTSLRGSVRHRRLRWLGSRRRARPLFLPVHAAPTALCLACISREGLQARRVCQGYTVVTLWCAIGPVRIRC